MIDQGLVPCSCFYNLLVSAYLDLVGSEDYWNPGNWNPTVGIQIGDCIEDFARVAPVESELKEKLEKDTQFWREAISHMERDSSPSDPQNRWSPLRDPPLALKSLVFTVSNVSSPGRIYSRTVGRVCLTENLG